ncbi:hypothetical protein WJX72_010273 [[Myrmecia] bisecta]|uniref:NADP-dependent oxidoreductase domain-containing protein n=1 Tax=[Myrmecia] bisecta TaxID=41462 RepID=A0AAW1PID3_9CHLO
MAALDAYVEGTPVDKLATDKLNTSSGAIPATDKPNTSSGDQGTSPEYHTVKNMPTAKLSSGHEIPIVGMGTWKSKPGEVGEAVKTALRAGYRHIDCAYIYKNEPEVGEAFQTIWKEGKVKREEVFITSKLWNSEHAAENVAKACRQTLKDLQLDYLDNYLIHWPQTGNEGPEVQPPIQETWQAMEKLVDEGLVRSIGLSNFSVKKTEAVLSYARIQPSIVQVEIHPYFRNDYLVKFCKEKGIHVTAYSPLGSPDSSAMYKRENVPWVLQDKEVQAVADKLGKSAGQVLIRWAIQHGTSVIPKSIKPERIRQNLDVLDWEIPQEDFQKLSSLQFQMRMLDGAECVKENGPYKSINDVWDGEVPPSNTMDVQKEQ